MSYATRTLIPSKCFDGTNPETAVIKKGILPTITHDFRGDFTYINTSPRIVIAMDDIKISGPVKRESKDGSYGPSALLTADFSHTSSVTFEERLIYEIQHAILMYVHNIYKTNKELFNKAFKKMQLMMTDDGYDLTGASVPITHLREEMRDGVRHIIRRTDQFTYVNKAGKEVNCSYRPAIGKICIETKERTPTGSTQILKETSDRIETLKGCKFMDFNLYLNWIRENKRNPKSEECKAAKKLYDDSVIAPWTIDTIDSYITDGTLCKTLVVSVFRTSISKGSMFSFKLKANQIIYDPTVVGELFSGIENKYMSMVETTEDTHSTPEKSVDIDVVDETQ